MDARREYRRIVSAGVVLMVVASAVAMGGCARSTNAPGASGASGASAASPAAAATLPVLADSNASTTATPLSANERLAGQMAEYDQDFVRVEDMSSVRKTYGIDITFPEVAAGGRRAGLWMQVPDVDGGFAWALYDTSGVEIEVWIAPSAAQARRRARLGDGGSDDRARETSADVNGYAAFVRPRVWVPEMHPNYTTGPSVIPAHWGPAQVRWAQGQCLVTITSRERDAEGLLGVAREVKITGTARMPAPSKKK